MNNNSNNRVSEGQMSSNKINTNRRKVVLGSVGLGALGSVLPQKWSTPLVSAVVSPVHAQMSPIPVCPALMVDNIVVTGPNLSGQPIGSCGVSFDILSSDPAQPLDVTSITNDASANVTIMLAAPSGVVSDTDGITVTAIGLSTACAPPTAELFEDVTFTIDATCENGIEPVQLVISLSELEGVTIAATA